MKVRKQATLEPRTIASNLQRKQKKTHLLQTERNQFKLPSPPWRYVCVYWASIELASDKNLLDLFLIMSWCILYSDPKELKSVPRSFILDRKKMFRTYFTNTFVFFSHWICQQHVSFTNFFFLNFHDDSCLVAYIEKYRFLKGAYKDVVSLRNWSLDWCNAITTRTCVILTLSLRHSFCTIQKRADIQINGHSSCIYMKKSLISQLSLQKGT